MEDRFLVTLKANPGIQKGPREVVAIPAPAQGTTIPSPIFYGPKRIAEHVAKSINQVLIDAHQKVVDMNLPLRCSCGCGLGAEHELGVEECFRKEVPEELKPHTFHTSRSPEGRDVEMCYIGSTPITVYTLKYQRGYAHHGNRRYSMPKSEKSTHSLEGFKW